MYGSCLAARRSKLVGGMSSMLPYAVIWHWYLLLCIYIICKQKYYCFCLFLFLILLKKAGINKSTEWSTIPVCPSLMCFLTGVIPMGLILRKFCVRRLCMFFVNLFQDLFCSLWIICGLRKRYLWFNGSWNE